MNEHSGDASSVHGVPTRHGHADPEPPPFGKRYWEDHWARAGRRAPAPANPYVVSATADLPPGSALDAGCGVGAEAIALAERGWKVTGADISPAALSTARARTEDAAARIEWVDADLTRWEPERTWDLVVTNYAHPDSGQLAFYRRLASWVAPGGSLLVIAHAAGGGHGHHPLEALASAEGVAGVLPSDEWVVDLSEEHDREVARGAQTLRLRDLVVRARRR